MESLLPFLAAAMSGSEGVWVQWWVVVTSAVALASAVAALTPTPKDDAIVGKLYKVVDWVALNVLKAKD